MEALIKTYPEFEKCKGDIGRALSLIIKTYEGGGKILLCGNGGSSSDCDHIAGELMKGFLLKRPIESRVAAKIRAAFPHDAEFLLQNLQGALPAVNLSHGGAMGSAFSNDVCPETVYAQQVLGLGREGDLLFAISTSGKSKNIISAAKVAKALKITTLALTGGAPSELSRIADCAISAPGDETYKIQEYHLPIYHYLCRETEKHFFGGGA